MIATKPHKIDQIAPGDPLVARMQAAPKFYIAPEIIDIMARATSRNRSWRWSRPALPIARSRRS